MRKVLILISLAFLISFASASSLTLIVSDTTGENGAIVEVPIGLEGATDIGSMDIVMSYDSEVLQATGVDTGKLGINAYIESNTVDDGEVIIALADASGISGNGPIAVVSFEVIGDTGSSSPLALGDISVHDIGRVEVITTTMDGTFSVTDKTEDAGYRGAGMLVISALIMALFAIKRKKEK
ncbi:cohesin domain-containing protein [Methanolobus sp. ZRKC5]|uniref:cohesin domain-containing protein n=1 Tax=unclassified Methanolobus TaxID=2629569 RepID=UPI00313E1D57